MKKNLLKLLLAGLLVCLALCGVAQAQVNVVATIFPLYDWVREIAGDAAQVSLLIDKRVDLHNYQVTVDDMLNIGTADLFIYVGGESDAWVDDAVAQVASPDMKALNLLEVLGENAREEEHIEGMQEEEEEEEEEGALDEHVWLSVRNAALFCQTICDTLSEIDPDNASIYAENTAAYIEKLNALDASFAEVVENGSRDTLVFGDRFPFRYLFADYGLSYYAAFSGCSAETEASFETIIFLAQKVDELKLPNILCIESCDGSIPETIKQSTQTKDQTILTMNSLQSCISEDVERGDTYLTLMEGNLEVLREALK